MDDPGHPKKCGRARTLLGDTSQRPMLLNPFKFCLGIDNYPRILVIGKDNSKHVPHTHCKGVNTALPTFCNIVRPPS